MITRIILLSLRHIQTTLRITGLVILLSSRGNMSTALAQSKDKTTPNDTVRQDSIINNRDLSENYLSLERMLPPTPQAAALARYGDYPVSLATGVPEISIPLYEIKLGNYTLPISISYHASGNKVDDIASPVGLGWVLNAGGAICRTVCGAPDLKAATTPLNTTYLSYTNLNNLINQTHQNGSNLTTTMNILLNGVNADYDTESDRYCYNLGTKSGVFRYLYSRGAFVTLNHHPIIIESHGYDDGYSKSWFSITDTDGTIYIFRDQEFTGLKDDENNCPVSAWYISEIKTPNGSITFSYQTTDDFYSFSYSETFKAGTFYRYDSSNHSYEQYVGIDSKKRRTNYLHRTLLLSDISWNGNHIHFTYGSRSDVNWKRLTKIDVRGCDGETFKTISLSNNTYLGSSSDENLRMLLSSISISDEGTYSFSYNSMALPAYYKENAGNSGVKCHTDFWGYYNGRNSTDFIPLNYKQAVVNAYSGLNVTSTANRNPSLTYTKAGILERITYPTGGYSQYTYELNHAGADDIGGLRVKSITDYDKDGSTLTKRNYSYTGKRTQDLPYTPRTYKTYHGYTGVAIGNSLNEYTTCCSDPLIPLTDGSGSPVIYTTVTETNLIANHKTVYNYMNGCIYDLEGMSTENVNPQLDFQNLNDEGSCNPLLLSKTIYNGSTAFRSETYSYTQHRLGDLEMGARVLCLVTVGDVNGNFTSIGENALTEYAVPRRSMTAHIKTYTLKSKTISDKQNGVSTKETFTYDSQYRTLLPKTVTTTNSDGKVFKTVNMYPFECSSNVCIGMYGANMADQVVASRLYVDNNFVKLDSIQFVNKNVNWYYPYKLFEQRSGCSLYEKLRFTNYDANGNPRTVLENGTDKTTLVWGFKSNWPVAKVSGLSYTNLTGLGLTSTLNAIARDSLPNNMTTRLAALRTGIGSNGLVTTYNYKPLYGISAITAENGYTTYYDYGTDGKLSAIRDANGPLHQYSYQYVKAYNGNTNSTNFVETKDMLSSTTGKITRQYYDGLGRSVQTARNITGSYVFTLQTYDQKGRLSQDWLPAVGSTSYGYMNSIASISNTTHNDSHAYSIITYDVLDRPTFIQTPGDAWHTASKGISKEYITNASNSVKRYSAALDNNSLIKNGYYAAKTLYGEKTTDEDGKSITVFTDKRGRKVLERRGTNNDTYYIYDDLDHLRFVLSPQYQDAGYKDVYGYEYRYDEKGRMVKKILPQCEYTQYWYDTAGRMKFMQDANLRSKGLYRFLLYDKYGRLCIQGTCTACWRGEAVNTATYNASGTGFKSTGYSLGRSSDISGTVTLEVVNYYDHYNFIRLYNSAVSADTTSTTTGLQTGRIRKASNGSTLTDAIYYDYKGRPVQTRSIQLGSRLTTTTTSYKYWGDIYKTVQTDYPSTDTSATPTLTSTTTNKYSSTTGLLSNTTLSLKRGTATAVKDTIRLHHYDGLGRVKKNTRNGSLETSYSYNLHNWLQEINGPGFHEWLYYDDAPNSGTPCYNGNISVQKWQASSDSQNRGYKFSYDALNRLKEAVYGERNFSDNMNDYDEKVVEYSSNSMMKRFQRRGKKSNGIYGKIDNLHISLDGNRPTSIIEDAGNQTVYGAMEFQSHGTSGTQYGYDDNGSLIWDANKQIAHITYDNLNHPKEVQFTNGNRIQYVYSPEGQKLRATWQTAVANIVVPLNSTVNLSSSQISSTTRTDYIGNVIYTGTASSSSASVKLSKYLFEGGYATVTPTTQPVFHYFTQDHLGNNRAVVNQSGTVEQITHYYPFGGFFADQGTGSSLQPYKYNGKELDRMHGLDLYDYGFRQYDPVVPMFTQQDPMAEKYYHLSPYAYCANNPVNAIDIEGKWVWPLVNAAIDYGFQVYDNYNTGMGSYDALFGNVNFARVGMSAVPLGKIKTVGTLMIEAAKTAISWSPNDGIVIENDVQTIAEESIKNTAIDKGVGKLVDKSSANSLKQAKQDTRSANKAVNTAENKARHKPKSTKRQASVDSAKKRLQQARENEVRTEMLHFTVGQFNSDAFDTFTTSGFQRITDLLNEEK